MPHTLERTYPIRGNSYDEEDAHYASKRGRKYFLTFGSQVDLLAEDVELAHELAEPNLH